MGCRVSLSSERVFGTRGHSAAQAPISLNRFGFRVLVPGALKLQALELAVRENNIEAETLKPETP